MLAPPAGAKRQLYPFFKQGTNRQPIYMSPNAIGSMSMVVPRLTPYIICPLAIKVKTYKPKHDIAFKTQNQIELSYKLKTQIMESLYGIETALKALFIFSAFIGSSYSLPLALGACLMAIYRRLKRIEFSRAYLEQVLRNQYGTNLLFLLSFSSVDKSLIFFYLPLTLHFATGISEYVLVVHKDNTLVTRYLTRYAEQIRTNRKGLLALKAKIEFVYLPIAIIMTLFNFGRLMSTFLYAQYILMRTRIGGDFTEAIGDLDRQLAPIANRFGLSGIYQKLKDVLLSVKSKFT